MKTKLNKKQQPEQSRKTVVLQGSELPIWLVKIDGWYQDVILKCYHGQTVFVTDSGRFNTFKFERATPSVPMTYLQIPREQTLKIRSLKSTLVMDTEPVTA
jgi:hypothetical protein